MAMNVSVHLRLVASSFAQLVKFESAEQ